VTSADLASHEEHALGQPFTIKIASIRPHFRTIPLEPLKTNPIRHILKPLLSTTSVGTPFMMTGWGLLGIFLNIT
jgi:hypothetical protein